MHLKDLFRPVFTWGTLKAGVHMNLSEILGSLKKIEMEPLEWRNNFTIMKHHQAVAQPQPIFNFKL